MKIPILGAVVLALVLGACTANDDTNAQTTTSTEQVTSTTAVLSVPPELADHDVDLVPVGDQLMLLAIADSPQLRSEGLKGVTDLADLDGMLFYWRHSASGSFWMKDTLIPLDIVWFNEDGSYAGRASMVPCMETPCTKYSPEGDPDYRFAIEANPGDLDWVDESTVIVYSD